MRPIGFSTGALALDDFRTALSILGGTTATAVELSALRQRELQPLVEALDGLTLDKYSHISVHLPSSIELEFECRLLDIVAQIPRDWPLIAHPNIITTPDKWRPRRTTVHREHGQAQTCRTNRASFARRISAAP